jgi:type I restriction enzyme M protein
MIDARNIYRKVTRKIYDFSPEQLQNLLAVVWLYRGQKERFLDLGFGYLRSMLSELGVFGRLQEQEPSLCGDFIAAIESMNTCLAPFSAGVAGNAAHTETMQQSAASRGTFIESIEAFQTSIEDAEAAWPMQRISAKALKQAAISLASLAEATRDLARQADTVFNSDFRARLSVTQI